MPSTNNNDKSRHNLSLKNRKELKIEGVKEVISYNDSKIHLQTNMGILNIKGENLNIQKLNLEETNLIIKGNINILEYSKQDTEKAKNIFKRIFK